MRGGSTETIAAISTPPGRGGIGVVRVSGPRAFHVAARLFRPRLPGRARRLRHGLVVDPADGLALDDVLLLEMPGPHTYTGEDVVEFQCHGSPRVLATVLRLCIELGARAAGPGEFTLRAFRNGRIDLTQAEAVMNLVAAETEAGAKLAAAQAQGSLGRALGELSARLVGIAAPLEAAIDFPDDEVPSPPAQDTLAGLAEVQAGLVRLADGAAAGRLIAAGAVVTIAGAPNAGKSSLFNSLLGEERAIVTETPGTTRDVVEARADWDGLPVTLRDTAGLREPTNRIEGIGIRLAEQAARDADLVLLVWDVAAGQPPGPPGAGRGVVPAAGGAAGRQAAQVAAQVVARAMGPVIAVANKTDLCGELPGRATVAEALGLAPTAEVVFTSAATGEGVGVLRATIVRELTGGGIRRETTLLTTARQERDVREALLHVQKATRAVSRGVPADVFLVEVYAAMDALAAARGRQPADVREDVVREVFSRFCVGK